jgi:hypothetical protein
VTSPGLGLLFGLINTTALHVAKGMQRQGINTLRWRSTAPEHRSPRHAAIYVAGVLLNQSTPVWLILANRFAAPAYATGMFGVGLVLLLLYSRIVIREPVAPVNYVGAIAVVAGTVLFSVHAVLVGDLDVAAMDRRRVFTFVVIYISVTLIAAILSHRSSRTRLVAAAFGLFAGGAASLDPILKALGQNAAGTASILPGTAWGWIPFGLSFVLGVSAFVGVQIAFLRGAAASVLVPIQSSVYVLVPVVTQLVCLPGYTASPVLAAGIAFIVGGIVLMQLRSRPADVTRSGDPPASSERFRSQKRSRTRFPQGSRTP